MSEPIRVLIVDDHTVVRDGLNALLSVEPGILVVGSAADGVEAVKLAGELEPDIILLDLVMPKMDGVQAINEIKNNNPEIKILVLTSFAENHQVYSAIKSGARSPSQTKVTLSSWMIGAPISRACSSTLFTSKCISGPWIFHGLDQDWCADLDVFAPGQEPDNQVGDVLWIKTFAVVQTFGIFAHLGDHHPRADRIDAHTKVLVFA